MAAIRFKYPGLCRVKDLMLVDEVKVLGRDGSAAAVARGSDSRILPVTISFRTV